MTYSEIVPLVEIRRIFSYAESENQRLPSGPLVMYRGCAPLSISVNSVVRLWQLPLLQYAESEQPGTQARPPAPAAPVPPFPMPPAPPVPAAPAPPRPAPPA